MGPLLSLALCGAHYTIVTCSPEAGGITPMDWRGHAAIGTPALKH
jgi:hypothetical protein